MSTCEPFSAGGPGGIADALSKVDCLATDATSIAFGRLFGQNGAFNGALTILLTLYIGMLAINLLTGRSALRLSMLTPRMINVGLILTFITSWVAYQSVVWNLAIGGPDEIAGVLVGSKGSATMLFAQQLDVFFDAITNAAAAAAPVNPAAATLTSPANILSLAAIILLLGTVGVLVVCRLALAALLILGPVFIVLALFDNTRGLFEGWLKSVAMFALVPLLTVVIGSGALLAIAPMIADLGAGGSEISLRSAVSVFVAAVVYASLMLVVLKVASSITRGWKLRKARKDRGTSASAAILDLQRQPAALLTAGNSTQQFSSERVRSALATLTATGSSSAAAPDLARLGHVASHRTIELTRPMMSENFASAGSRLDYRTKGVEARPLMGILK